MSRRGGTRKRNERGNETQASWQPTINRYFGGKSISVQPTLQHFVRKTQPSRPVTTVESTAPSLETSRTDRDAKDILILEDENVKPERWESKLSGAHAVCSDRCVDVLTTVRDARVSKGLQQATASCNKGASPPARGQVDSDTTDRICGSHNPFAVRQVDVKSAVQPIPHVRGGLVEPDNAGVEFTAAAGAKKLLSLKRRKRKLPDSPSKAEGLAKLHNSKVFRTSTHTRACGNRRSVNNSVACFREGGEGQTPCTSSNDPAREGLSSDDLVLLQSYSSPVETSTRLSLRDLEQFESNKQTSGPHASRTGLHVNTPLSSSPSTLHQKIPSLLPTTPTFSPHKHPPTAFSPLFERSTDERKNVRALHRSHDHSNEVTCSSHDHVSDYSKVLADDIRSGTVEGKLENVHLTDERAKRVLFHTSKGNSELQNLSLDTTHGHPQSEVEIPSSKSGDISAQTQQEEVSNNDCTRTTDFSYEGDFSFSELMDQSLLVQEPHEQSVHAACRSHELSSEVTCRAHDLNRYLVLESTTQEYMEESAALNTMRRKQEVVLRLFNEQTSTEQFCYLRDDWLQTDISPGDVVQVNATFDHEKGGYVVGNVDGGSVIVDPDQLISGTTVANSISCVRRAVLGDRFSGGGKEGEAMLIGKLLHEVFQRMLVGWDRGEEVTKERVEEEICHVTATMETLDQLYAVGLMEGDVVAKLHDHIPAMLEWCARFLHSDPVPGEGDIEFKRTGSGAGQSCVAISKVLDIEENIWSPRFGLKGKVDVTVQVKERRYKGGGERGQCGGVVETYRAPLELKTGKMFRRQGTIEHRAQVALYTVMLGDRYSSPPSPPTPSPPGGLLFYLKGGHMQGLPALPHEKRGLLIARNHLARYRGNHGDHVTMPGMLRDGHTCKHCPQLAQCMLYHKAAEHGSAETSGVGDLFTLHTSHLPPSHLTFFTTWYTLTMQEDVCCKGKSGRAFWLDSADEREREGRCVADMVVRPAVSNGASKYLQVLSKCGGGGMRQDLPLLLHKRVVVSRQDGSGWAVAIGMVSMVISSTEVQLSLDKPLPVDGTVYRLDEAPSHFSGTLLSNLADLCTSDSERDHSLRELVIDLRSPRFSAQENLSDLPEHLWCNLNSSQKSAIVKVLSALDYALILGMPGTGKTTTIACLVRVLVARGHSVMLASYTHSAVDNILLKLKDAGVDFLRLGPSSRVHADILPYTPAQAARDISTVQALEQLYHSKPVVAATCLSTHHPVFSKRLFDYCILDEASQITLPVSLGPLRHARVFLLVGDHYQLPPLVQSEQAREGGFDVSLFRRLTEHHPAALVSLREQYRMNREIMLISNMLIYNHQLTCGNDKVASTRLHMPHWGDMVYHRQETWLLSALDPAIPVIFLSTDKCEAGETINGNHLHNDFESLVVRRVVLELLKGGVDVGSVGVITPYRHHQNVIRELLRNKSNTQATEDVEVNTVDCYQGRDKDCIIVSFVRSNTKGNVGTLLHDWRRINVALTRARHKLVLVGSEETLRHAPLLAALLQLLREKEWMVELLPDV